MKQPPAFILRHWAVVRAVGCLITQSPEVQVCHCWGPSMNERNPRFRKPKGEKPLWSHYLVVPLSPRLHTMMDSNQYAFAREHGTPASLLDILCEKLDFDCWAAAEALLKPVPLREPACS